MFIACANAASAQVVFGVFICGKRWGYVVAFCVLLWKATHLMD